MNMKLCLSNCFYPHTPTSFFSTLLPCHFAIFWLRNNVRRIHANVINLVVPYLPAENMMKLAKEQAFHKEKLICWSQSKQMNPAYLLPTWKGSIKSLESTSSDLKKSYERKIRQTSRKSWLLSVPGWHLHRQAMWHWQIWRLLRNLTDVVKPTKVEDFGFVHVHWKWPP